MFLSELFENHSMVTDLRIHVMDYLTPLAANKKEFITMKEVGVMLHELNVGVVIDRELIMKIVDPNICKLVNKIEGDNIYLSYPSSEISSKVEDDKERDIQKIKDTAAKMATKEIKK